MAKLHEALAVEGNLEGLAKKVLAEAVGTFTKRTDHFTGFHKTLQMDEEGAMGVPDESKELTTTVGDKLDYLEKHLVKYWDCVLQKEATNQVAKSDIVVDGEVLANDVPATFLLGMETKLKNLREVYSFIPTLQPGVAWEKDESQNDQGRVWKASQPQEKIKTKRVSKSQVLYEATEHHPAQIDKWEEQERVGVFVTNV